MFCHKVGVWLSWSLGNAAWEDLMIEVPDGPCFQASPGTLSQRTYPEKEGEAAPATCPFTHSQLCVVTPPTFSPSPLSPLIWSTGTSHQAAEGGPCALALSSLFSSTAWQSARGRIKEGNIRWRNLLRNLPVFGEKHGCRRYVYLVMRDRYDVTHPKALSGLSCKAQGFLVSCPTPAEALGGVQRHQCPSTVGTQRTHTVFFISGISVHHFSSQENGAFHLSYVTM